MALAPASQHDARPLPVPVQAGEEVGDHVTCKIGLEGPHVHHTHAVWSRVACAADGFERATDKAVGDWAGRIHGSVCGGESVALGDLVKVVSYYLSWKEGSRREVEVLYRSYALGRFYILESDCQCSSLRAATVTYVY